MKVRSERHQERRIPVGSPRCLATRSAPHRPEASIRDRFGVVISVRRFRCGGDSEAPRAERRSIGARVD
jgi:hypothetical protein